MKYLIDTDWLIDHLSGVEKVKDKSEELAPEGLAIRAARGDWQI